MVGLIKEEHGLIRNHSGKAPSAPCALPFAPCAMLSALCPLRHAPRAYPHLITRILNRKVSFLCHANYLPYYLPRSLEIFPLCNKKGTGIDQWFLESMEVKRSWVPDMGFRLSGEVAGKCNHLCPPGLIVFVCPETTAKCVRKASISRFPISCGWRFLWNKIYLLIQET